MISSAKATQVAVSHENTESSLLVATIYLVILREQEAPLRISALSVTLACQWALRSHRALSSSTLAHWHRGACDQTSDPGMRKGLTY